MRILVWYWGRRGGGPRYALELLRALTERTDVDLAVSLSSGNEALEEFEALACALDVVETYSGVTSFVTASLQLPLIRHRFQAAIARSGADAVVSIMPHPWSWYLAPAVPSAGSRLISIIHDAYTHPGEANPLWKWRIGRELHAAAGVVALSQHVKRQLVEGYGYPTDRIAVMPLGPFAYAEAGPVRRFPRGRPFRFLFFGRLMAYKGLQLLLEAFRQLAALRPDVELHIVGSGDLSAYRAQLATVPRVTVINRWIEDREIPALFAGADALVAAYTEASQSAAIATAHGSGLPVVVTPVGGLVEQVMADETGIVATSPSPGAVADAMLGLLDPGLYERCASATTSQASGTGGWRRTAGDLVEYCRRVIESETRGP